MPGRHAQERQGPRGRGATTHPRGLKEHLARYVDKEPGALVFPALRYACHFNDSVFAKHFAKAVGRDDVRIHDLRHFAGTQAARVGSVTEVMDRLGHSTPRASLMYQGLASGPAPRGGRRTVGAGRRRRAGPRKQALSATLAHPIALAGVDRGAARLDRSGAASSASPAAWASSPARQRVHVRGRRLLPLLQRDLLRPCRFPLPTCELHHVHSAANEGISPVLDVVHRNRRNRRAVCAST